MTLSFTFDLMFVLAALGGILALIDGIIRTRSRSAVIGIIEIVASALFVLSLFFAGIPLGALVLAIITAIVLIIGLIIGPSRVLAIVALILVAAWIVLGQRWVIVPGVNG